MKAWTGIEIEKARKGLEQASATILGRMIFEFSRLDIALGLFLVWSGDGQQLEKLTKEVGEYSFHKKLDMLQALSDKKYAIKPEVHSEYRHWLSDAHLTRVRRNELVHGRWGIDPIGQRVVNVIGLPTSERQREVHYSIAELKTALEEMKSLQTRLHSISEKSPV